MKFVKTKRALAMALAAQMCLGTMTTAAFATDAEDNYVYVYIDIQKDPVADTPKQSDPINKDGIKDVLEAEKKLDETARPEDFDSGLEEVKNPGEYNGTTKGDFTGEFTSEKPTGSELITDEKSLKSEYETITSETEADNNQKAVDDALQAVEDEQKAYDEKAEPIVDTADKAEVDLSDLEEPVDPGEAPVRSDYPDDASYQAAAETYNAKQAAYEEARKAYEEAAGNLKDDHDDAKEDLDDLNEEEKPVADQLIKDAEDAITAAQERLDAYIKSSTEYNKTLSEEYTKAVEAYNKLVQDYKKLVDDHNAKVDADVQEYNDRVTAYEKYVTNYQKAVEKYNGRQDVKDYVEATQEYEEKVAEKFDAINTYNNDTVVNYNTTVDTNNDTAKAANDATMLDSAGTTGASLWDDLHDEEGNLISEADIHVFNTVDSWKDTTAAYNDTTANEEYNRNVAAYNRVVAAYNQVVNKWNNQQLDTWLDEVNKDPYFQKTPNANGAKDETWLTAGKIYLGGKNPSAKDMFNDITADNTAGGRKVYYTWEREGNSSTYNGTGDGEGQKIVNAVNDALNLTSTGAGNNNYTLVRYDAPDSYNGNDSQVFDFTNVGKWTLHVTDNGAENYTSGGYAWHLDGVIRVKQLATLSTLETKYVVKETEDITAKGIGEEVPPTIEDPERLAMHVTEEKEITEEETSQFIRDHSVTLIEGEDQKIKGEVPEFVYKNIGEMVVPTFDSRDPAEEITIIPPIVPPITEEEGGTTGGGTTTPAPAVIPDEPTPLADIPEVPVPQEETPVEAPEETVEIAEEPVPLAEIPDELTEIDSVAVPLADVPQTGDVSLAWYFLAVLSLGGVLILSAMERREHAAK